MTFALIRTFRAEALKLRRTRALWLAGAAPLSVIALYTLLILTGGADPSGIGWDGTAGALLGLWAMLMLPLYVALLTALINGVDHDAHGWKHLFALPVPRWCVHMAKLGAALALAAFSSFVLAAGVVVMIGALKIAGFGGTEAGTIPYRLAFEGAARTYAGAFFIIAIHHALSQRVRGFEWPIGIGIVATIFATQAVGSPDYWLYLPWTYPTITVGGNDPSAATWAIGLSTAGGMLAALLAAWDTQQRDITT